MTLWEKVKCFFGFCPVTKEQEQAIMETYKAEPKVQKVTDKAQKKLDEIVSEVKVEKAKAVKKAKKTAKKVESKVEAIIDDVKDAIDVVEDIAEDIIKVVKAKRSWYTNGKKQQLVTEDEVKGLPKTWKKGKLKKDK